MITEINVVNEVLAEHMTEFDDFKEFCSILDEMEMITEAVGNVDQGNHRQLQKIATNTAKTTRDIGKIYGITTDAGGAAIKSVWDLIMKLLGLASKAIFFIVNKIIKIPQALTKLIDKVSKIPVEIRTKIRGDIKLYLTIEDIQLMQNQFLINHMTNLIKLASKFSKGDAWTSFFNVKKVDDDRNIKFGETDQKLLKRMRSEFNYFAKLSITPTVVNMSDSKTVEGYFGDGKIHYVDINGTEHDGTYYECLKDMIDRISEAKGWLDDIYKEIGDKLKRTQDNGSFATLPNAHRNGIINGMSMITNTVNIVGNIIRYMMTDVATIQKTTDQIIAQQKKIADRGGVKKKLIGRDDSAIENLSVNNAAKEDSTYEHDMHDKGYVKIPKTTKDKTGRVVKEYQGTPHQFNSDIVWVKKGDVPKGVKIIK